MENRKTEDWIVSEKPIEAIVLSDDKAGHYNQSLGITQRIRSCHSHWIVVKFHSKWHDNLLRLLSCLFGGFQLPHWFIKQLLHIGLQPETLAEIFATKRADFILSTGSSLAAINLLLGKLFGAKTVTCRRPSPVGTAYFDLAILPQVNWPHRDKKNVCKTIGVPNSVSQDNLDARREQLQIDLNLPYCAKIGVLIGGEDRYDTITEQTATCLINALQRVATGLNCQFLLTTSRRTPHPVTKLIRKRLSDSDLCPILVVADRESPIANPVEAILALSDLILVTEDSFSMVCEAASSGRHTFILQIDRKTHRRPRRCQVYPEIMRHASVAWHSIEDLEAHIQQVLADHSPIKSLCDTQLAATAVVQMLGK